MTHRSEIMSYVAEPSAEYKAAFLAWCAYFFRTENYDRHVCSYRGRHGDVVPTTAEERRLVSINAARERAALAVQLAASGVDAAAERMANEAAGRLTFERLRLVLEESATP